MKLHCFSFSHFFLSKKVYLRLEMHYIIGTLTRPRILLFLPALSRRPLDSFFFFPVRTDETHVITMARHSRPAYSAGRKSRGGGEKKRKERGRGERLMAKDKVRGVGGGRRL